MSDPKNYLQKMKLLLTMIIQKPMNIKTEPWIYEYNDTLTTIKCGKWMLFFNEKMINEKWKNAVQLFRKKVFPGIKLMKCSTALNNTTDKVIIFYCNKSDEKNRIINIGKNIMNKLNYQNDLYYKTDRQTLKGIESNGNNYIYKIEYSFNAFDNDSD